MLWITPRCWRIGTKIIQALIPPSSMLQDTRSPVMAPAAMNIGSHESITVRPIHAGPSTRSLNAPTHVPIMNGASFAFTTTRPSAQNLLTRAISPARPSARAERAAASPTECSARSVSAAAIPLGNRSCLTLIICLFIGIAMVTPMTATKKIQANMTDNGISVLLSSM